PAPRTRPAQWPAPSGVARTRNAAVTSAPPAPYFQLTSGLRPGGTSLKTGLRSRRHHQPHGSYALDQSERYETPDPLRSDAVDSRFMASGSRPMRYGVATGDATGAKAAPVSPRAAPRLRHARQRQLQRRYQGQARASPNVSR